MNERILELRKALNLNQTEFGKRIGLTTSGVSNIEVGIREVQERHIKLILSEFPYVNEEWLRSGKGGMFVSKQDVSIESIVKKHSFPEICAKLLYTYDALAPDQQKVLLDYAHNFIITMMQDNSAQVAAEIADPLKQEASRQALSQRAKAETSSTSSQESAENV